MLSRRSEQQAGSPPEFIPLAEVEAALRAAVARGESGIVDAVDMAIAQGVLHDASDIYFEPWRDGLHVRFRLDGVLHDVGVLPRENQEHLVSRIKVLARNVVYQRDLPQDGRIEAGPRTLGRSLRVSTFPTVHGENALIRILNSDAQFPDLAELGFGEGITEGVMEWTRRNQGALLLTGPSSSGKTTTIYAILRAIVGRAGRARHVVTVEDPVEYSLDGVTQAQIRPAQGFDYDAALKGILRQDPEVIMVGEVRDPSTARTVIQAGLTGHLVLSTIHSGTSAGVFCRLLDMGIEPFLVASAVSAVLAQRLLRLNCAQCTASYVPDKSLRDEFGVEQLPMAYQRGSGCPECNGIGLQGRTAIGEWLTMNDELADQIMRRDSLRALQKTAGRLCTHTLLSEGVHLVGQGRTTLEELKGAILVEEYQA
jgi:type II secretory ATPase GspE/PulE/Tfp pilus assembly ATPase PilB-like protein